MRATTALQSSTTVALLSRITAALVFLLCTNPRSYSAPRDGCEAVRSRNHRIGRELTDARVLRAATTAIQASGLQGPVLVCTLLMPYLTATVEYVEDSYYVSVTNLLLERFSHPELQAVFGHEIAHVVLGHRAPAFELTHNRSAKYEQEADALSAEWFGKP